MGSDVPDFMRTDRDDRIRNSGWALSEPQAGMTAITFQSATYNDMRQLLAREATGGAVTVKATLGFPEQTKDRIPQSSSFTHSPAIATRTKAMSRPNCARQASPR